MIHKLLFTFALLSGAANAAIVQYANFSTFSSATGATALAALPNVGVVGWGYTNSGTNYSETTGPGMYVGTAGVPSLPDGWSTLIEGNEVALAYENLRVTLAAPAYSFGFYIDEPSGVRSCGVITCVDSNFTITARSSGSAVGTFQFNATDNVAWFIGFSSDTAFDQVDIFEDVTNDDNEYFGQFYSGAQPVVSGVPEPSTMTLAFGSLTLLALSRLRRRS